LYIKLFSKYKNVFSVEGHPAYVLIGLFVIVTFIPYIMFAQIAGRTNPEIRIIIQSLYLLIPLAFLGISKALDCISPLIKFEKYYLIFPLVAILVLSFSFLQMYQGINSIDNLQKSFAENKNQKALDNWLTNNIPEDTKIASDLPHAILLKTGHPSINFAHLYKDNTSYEEWLIKKFDIDYFVFYYVKDKPPYELTNLELQGFNLQKIYQGDEGGLVYRIVEK
jgi:hypothetical protein